jgi:XTP/dITP diphosphohydrolase
VGRLRVALASNNKGKLRELRALFPDWKIEPIAADYPEETGETFYENAVAKARFVRIVVTPEVPVVGEDSGLEVDALGGRPGVRSARFAGPEATDDENVERLLRELDAVSEDERGARYVSELVLLSSHEDEFRGTGTLEGRIATERKGSEGFGYDPVFVPRGHDRTVAELGDAWKRENSHRARAGRALLERLGKTGGAV